MSALEGAADGFEFDADTAVEPLGRGRFGGVVSPRWSIGPYPNGGYLLALAMAAVRRTATLPDPMAVSAHFLRPSEHAHPCEIEVATVRSGRSHATLEARLAQDGVERLRAIATLGDLGALTGGGPTAELGTPPDLPPLASCPRDRGGARALPNGLVAAIRDRLDVRFDPSTLGFANASPSGRGLMQGWVRLRDGREPDTAALVLLCDCLPPAVFDIVVGGWVPTLELTVHIRARPSPGWLACRFTTTHLRDGYLEEAGEIWDSAGVMVCQSLQFARVNPPPSSG